MYKYNAISARVSGVTNTSSIVNSMASAFEEGRENFRKPK